MTEHLKIEEESRSDADLRLGSQLTRELFDNSSDNGQTQSQSCAVHRRPHLLGAFKRDKHCLELVGRDTATSVGNDNLDGNVSRLIGLNHLVAFGFLQSTVHLDESFFRKLDRIGDQVGDDRLDLSRVANDVLGQIVRHCDLEIDVPSRSLGLVQSDRIGDTLANIERIVESSLVTRLDTRQVKEIMHMEKQRSTRLMRVLQHASRILVDISRQRKLERVDDL